MTHVVLAVPEILRLICELLTKSDLTRLLTVSRRFFASAVPLVWHTVFDFNTLRGLLTTVDWPSADNLHLVDDKVQPLNDQCLNRFNLYAPHVRRLRQLTGPKHGVQITFWGMLLKLVRTRPLFPNLQALELSRLSWHDESKFISHINAFLCPTLTEIRCPGPNAQMLSMLLASQLSARLVEQCPTIHTLDIYTDYTMDNDNREDTLIPKLGLLSSADLSSSLENFQNLRNFGAGPEVLSPEGLVTLGTLPLLESFTIVYVGEAPEMLIQTTVAMPQDAFPALRHLGIYCLDWVELATELWKLPSLVQQLVSVHIDLDSAFISDEQMCHLICLICGNSPLVSDLHIDLDPSGERELIDLFSPTVMNHLQQLPLRRLRIVASHDCCILKPASNFEQLVLALTNIEYLHMKCYYWAFKDLVLVAKHMSKLRFLAISPTLLHLRWPSENQLPRLINSNPTLYLCTWLWYNKVENAKHISLALCSLWPNGVHWMFLQGAEVFTAYIHKEVSLNREIRKSCAPSAFSVALFENFAMEWKYINKCHIPWLANC